MYQRLGIAALVSIVFVAVVAVGRKVRLRHGELTVVAGR